MNTIDADGHIVEKDADVRKFLAEPHCNRGRPLLPADGMDTSMGGRVGGREDCDVATRLRDMDTEGTRMDEEWEKRGKVEAPLCRNKPSEYVKHGNWFFATEPEEETLPYVVERIGDDKILFASDYPHWDGLFPYVVSTIRGRKDLSEDAKRKILGENAKRFYGWS